MHKDEDGKTENAPEEARGAARTYHHRARVPKYLPVDRSTAHQQQR
jgi:hypothetical protein